MVGRSPVAGLLVLAAALALGACGSLTSPTPARPSGTATLPSAGAVTPTPPDPTPRRTLAPLDVSTATWELVADLPTVDGPSTVTGFVGFSGGYVGMGTAGRGAAIPTDPDQVAWFSPDGARWSARPLMQLATNCPGWGIEGDELVWDGETRAVGTNGRSVVIVGEVVDYGSSPCGHRQPVSWISDDGLTWQRSAAWDSADGDLRATTVWPMSGGWQASSEQGLWQSPDALAWQRIDDRIGLVTAAAANGTVIAGWDPTVAPESERLQRSSDGRTWTPVAIPTACPTRLLLPPAPGALDAWVVAGLGVCTSADLDTWPAGPLDVAFWGAAQTRYGAIVLGDRCYDINLECDQRPLAFLSVDGRAWEALPSMPSRAWTIADGPAGVLLIGERPDAPGSLRVWRLAAGED